MIGLLILLSFSALWASGYLDILSESYRILSLRVWGSPEVVFCLKASPKIIGRRDSVSSDSYTDNGVNVGIKNGTIVTEIFGHLR